MPKKTSSTDILTGSITSEDVLGKDVIDPRGEFVGVSDKLLLDPKTLQVLGISVDKGFLKKGLIIGTDYIGEVTSHAILLNKQLHIRVKDMTVYGSDGAIIGTVSNYETGVDGSLSALHVKAHMFSKLMYMPSTWVDKIENSVLLNKSKSEVITLTQQ